jgi:3-hydroxy-9,10-secoandrosta-1,3,5(10)-triene-9,17-dione monooxygenase
MTQPRRFGGLELTPAQAWEAVFEVSRGCSSSAWIVGLVAANVLMLGKFSDQAQRDVFLCGKPAIVPMLTGGVGQDVVVKPVDGGATVSGRWRYASGIDVASWVGLLVPVPSDEGAAEPHVVLVPVDRFEIDHESWNVLGMRGTGSKDIALAPTFVPEHRWARWSVLQAGEQHPDCGNDEALYHFPLNAAFALSIAAPTLGVASAVAEEFRSIVKGRVGSGTKQQQAQDKLAQILVASGEATMAMLRRSLLADADSLLDQISAGIQPSLADRGGVRMRVAIAARQALAEAQRMFAALGGSLLPSGTRIERLFRDVHAMSSHFLLQPDAVGEAYGRLLLGIELPTGARL